jgi:hypothetical protein
MFKFTKKITEMIGILSDAVVLMRADDGVSAADLDVTIRRLWTIIEPVIPEELRRAAGEVHAQVPKIEVWSSESMTRFGAALLELFSAVEKYVPNPYREKVVSYILAAQLLVSRAITLCAVQKMIREHAKNGTKWECPKCQYKNDAVFRYCISCSEPTSPEYVDEELAILCEDIRCVVNGGTPE